MGSSARVHTLITLVVWAGVVWFAAVALQLSLVKGYSIDEFTYSHGAWLVSKGLVPYRDFFETRFPLHYAFFAVPFLFTGDAPEAIVFLRVVQVPFVAAIALAVYRLAGRDQAGAGPIAVLVVLGNVIFAISATEIRPDPIALCFFLLALCALGIGSWAPTTRALVSGALLALSVWGTAKAAIYGLAFLPVWLLDVVWNARRRAGFVLGSPALFVAGGAGVAAVALAYLIATGAWPEFYRLAVVESFDFVGGEASRSRSRGLLRLLDSLRWLVPLVAWGVISTLQGIRKSERPSCHPDLLLLCALPSTLLSYSIQSYAFRYSHIPFIALFGVFAGRGAASLLEHARSPARRPAFAAALLIVATLPLAATFVESRAPFASIRAKRNTYQGQILRTLGELTAADDAVYDNSGSYVARPHAYSPHHTSRFMRIAMAEQLAREVPESIEANEAVAVIRDARFEGLAPALKQYLVTHFQPFTGELWLWGKRYRTDGAAFEGEFRAIERGRYFVSPASALERGSLEVGGQVVTDRIFPLEKGVHVVRYEGSERDFYLLWLPRNGEPYEPYPNRLPRFSRVLFDP